MVVQDEPFWQTKSTLSVHLRLLHTQWLMYDNATQSKPVIPANRNLVNCTGVVLPVTTSSQFANRLNNVFVEI